RGEPELNRIANVEVTNVNAGCFDTLRFCHDVANGIREAMHSCRRRNRGPKVRDGHRRKSYRENGDVTLTSAECLNTPVSRKFYSFWESRWVVHKWPISSSTTGFNNLQRWQRIWTYT